MKPRIRGWPPLSRVSSDASPRERLFVLIGAYNHGEFIAQTIEGALSQVVDVHYQILVRDDASTDGTAETILSYAKEHPERIVPVMYMENQRALGKSWTNDLLSRSSEMARLDNAEKVYIALCEGDDYWTDSTKLQRQVDFLRENPTAALVHHAFDIVVERGGDAHYESDLRRHLALFEPHPPLRKGSDLLRGNFIMTCTVMMRLSGWKSRERASRPIGLLGDWVSFFVACEGRRVGFINRVMATYRVHAGGMHSSRDDEERGEVGARTLDYLKQRKAQSGMNVIQLFGRKTRTVRN